MKPRESLRRRLLLLALLPLGSVLPLLLIVLTESGSLYVDRLLAARVGADLVVANTYYERVSATIGAAVDGLAGSTRLAARLDPPGRSDQAALADWLASERQRLHLDFLQLLDPQGCPWPPAQAAKPGACLSDWPVVDSARRGRARTENDVFPAELLAAIDPALAATARMPLVSTLNAAPDTRAFEDRGLVVHSAAPVLDRQGRLIAVLDGGVLLNRNLDFVDRLNEVVYPAGGLPLDSTGTATLFLGDVRIATNVRLFAGERAIGTRVSRAVRDTVLDQGQVWQDRAFVVQDWYFSGYQPLLDSHGQRVGMLYVGFLERPFAAAKTKALWLILALFGGAMLIAGAFAIVGARRIFRPVERMHSAMNAIELGDANARVGPLARDDELGELARHFDRLVDRQEAQASMLKQRGETLDQEVARRTAELERALADLRATQGKLVMNEKLAAIGQLTAGIAHEINNPLAVIQGNLELARELLGPQAEPVRPELALILEQVHRIRLIVTKLLQFARPQDYAGYLEPVQPAQLIPDCLLLVSHHLKKGNIAIAQLIHSHRAVTCNRIELQQVVINLLVNAIQAMPEGGSLEIAVDDWDEAEMPVGIQLSVSDSGPGMAANDLAHLFEPFFTVNKPGGHGLGLWVSQTLVERYGGRLSAENRPAGGARFTIWLRCEPLA